MRVWNKDRFLTEVAKDYDPEIDGVFFVKIPGCTEGHAWKTRDGFYRIEIDSEKQICPYQTFHVFFHEVAHVVLGHCDISKDALSYPIYNHVELEAKRWAFEKMGHLDSKGKVKEDLWTCHYCINNFSKECLKDSSCE